MEAFVMPLLRALWMPLPLFGSRTDLGSLVSYSSENSSVEKAESSSREVPNRFCFVLDFFFFERSATAS